MKLFRLALVSSSLVFALGTAQASDTAVINLSATVSPGSCEIAASNTDLDVGSISFGDLNQNLPFTEAFAENATITITCTALHQGVYFTVTGAAGDTGAGLFSLGNFADTTVNAGSFSLAAANPVFTGSASADDAVQCRETVADAPIGCPATVRSDRQYTFAAVTEAGIEAMSFDLEGSLVLPSLDDLAAAGVDTNAAQTFSTSYTVTAVF